MPARQCLTASDFGWDTFLPKWKSLDSVLELCISASNSRTISGYSAAKSRVSPGSSARLYN